MRALKGQIKFDLVLKGDDWSLHDFEPVKNFGEGSQGFLVLVHDCHLGNILALKYLEANDEDKIANKRLWRPNSTWGWKG